MSAGEDMGKAVVRVADIQQYAQAPMPKETRTGPQVKLLNATPDPLGTLAAITAMYKGRVVRSLSEVTDEERRAALADMQATVLDSALESVNFVFLIEGVDRAFTHQMVRGRHAMYVQESLRFAVPEDWAGGIPLPPTLRSLRPDDPLVRMWQRNLNNAEDAYAALVANGMPAEEARKLLPHAVLTRIHWVVSLRELLNVAGLRTCTQAQFDWRIVMGQIARVLRLHSSGVRYINTDGLPDDDRWQFEFLADQLRPVCYQTGRCGFMAAFDRACTIRARVAENEHIGRSSSQWHLTHDAPDAVEAATSEEHASHFACEDKYVGAIDPREWAADPAAARVRGTE
jgi:flavin-dependent thymidylate synthase